MFPTIHATEKTNKSTSRKSNETEKICFPHWAIPLPPYAIQPMKSTQNLSWNNRCHNVIRIMAICLRLSWRYHCLLLVLRTAHDTCRHYVFSSIERSRYTEFEKMLNLQRDKWQFKTRHYEKASRNSVIPHPLFFMAGIMNRPNRTPIIPSLMQRVPFIFPIFARILVALTTKSCKDHHQTFMVIHGERK